MTHIVHMAQAIELLEEAKAIAEQLDGVPPNQDALNSKERMRVNAERSRLLLYAAHVADLARAEILNQYHGWKGETPPTIKL